MMIPFFHKFGQKSISWCIWYKINFYLNLSILNSQFKPLLIKNVIIFFTLWQILASRHYIIQLLSFYSHKYHKRVLLYWIRHLPCTHSSCFWQFLWTVSDQKQSLDLVFQFQWKESQEPFWILLSADFSVVFETEAAINNRDSLAHIRMDSVICFPLYYHTSTIKLSPNVSIGCFHFWNCPIN